MIDVVVSEPVGKEVLTSPDGPIWVNAKGKQFRVGTGPVDALPDGAWTPDSADPVPAAPAVVAGLDALEALAAMGLMPLSKDF
jgi:hypothetical protein